MQALAPPYWDPWAAGPSSPCNLSTKPPAARGGERGRRAPRQALPPPTRFGRRRTGAVSCTYDVALASFFLAPPFPQWSRRGAGKGWCQPSRLALEGGSPVPRRRRNPSGWPNLLENRKAKRDRCLKIFV